ncbi:hypothetical protein Tco_0059077 [Tanacetum coccineum]
MPSVILVRTVASISIGGVLQKILVNHCLDGFWSHVVWVGVVNRVFVLLCVQKHPGGSGILASGPGCLALLFCSRSDNNSACMSLIFRLMSLMTQRGLYHLDTDVIGQSLKAVMLTPAAASESESHVLDAVSE